MSTDTLPGRLQATFWPASRVPADGHVALWGTLQLADAAAALGLPPGTPATLPTLLPRTPRARTRVVAADVPARVIPVLAAARALAALPAPHDWPPWERPADSVLAWSLAAKLALEWVAAGRLVPTLRAAGPLQAVALTRAVPSADGRLAELAGLLPPAAHALRTDEDEEAVWAPAHLLAAFADAVADASVRALAAGDGDRTRHARSAGRRLPTSRDTRSWPQRWSAALAGEDPVIDIDAEDLVDRVAVWQASVARRDGQAAARLCLRLHTPDGNGAFASGDGRPAAFASGDGRPAADAADERWPLDFLLQAADDPSLLVPAERVWAQGSASLDLLGRRVGDPQETLVRGLAEAARLFPPIDRSLSERRPDGLLLDAGEAAELLTGGAAALTEAGLGVLLPSELTASGARRLRARLRIGRGTPDPGKGITGAGLNADGLAEYRWEVALGDETLDAEDFEQIVAAKQPLVRWRGRWVRVDPDEALRLRDLAGRAGSLSVAEALAAALTGEADDPDLGSVEVIAHGSLAALRDRLRAALPDGGRAGGPDPRLDGVQATLRDYQRTGVAWLQQLCDLGLGALLADDMGLGKTLQTIAVLADRTTSDGGRPHLVVCPTSVVGNWERELARFAPHLDVVRHHGPERPDDPAAFPAGAVAVTSYQLARRDADLLAAVDWDVVVLDEAQQVKNPAAKGARAVRRFPARARLALTGTPVENRLSELWSIMDFANPGLLGRFEPFKRRYAIPIERWQDPEATARLRRLSAPFLLRRTKSEVARDLPPKHEMTVVCSLTREQATLYQAAVDEGLRDGLGEGIDRRGRILALLTALKQICNHPAQYLGEAVPEAAGTALARRSGKLARVTEMLSEVTAAGDRALVFTQYRRMGDLLAVHIAESLGLAEVPFLHGGVPRTAREAMVARFQEDDAAPPIMLVSLKAGGTGLNLTRATEVVHYDRWWNPAVEDQATDRTYRIGQTRAVTAHKLVTAGTLEEKISQLLERKRALAAAVVGTGETWLTELSDDELRAIVALDDGDVADDEEAA